MKKAIIAILIIIAMGLPLIARADQKTDLQISILKIQIEILQLQIRLVQQQLADALERIAAGTAREEVVIQPAQNQPAPQIKEETIPVPVIQNQNPIKTLPQVNWQGSSMGRMTAQE